LTGRQICWQLQIANGTAVQSFHPVANSRQHALDLVVLALCEGEFQMGV